MCFERECRFVAGSVGSQVGQGADARAESAECVGQLWNWSSIRYGSTLADRFTRDESFVGISAQQQLSVF